MLGEGRRAEVMGFMREHAPGKRGQAAAIDFMFGLFIFLLIVAWLLGVWSNNLDVALEEHSFGDLREKGYQIMEVLVRTPGTPGNWENTAVAGDANIYDANAIGLASKDRVIDEGKLQEFIYVADVAHDYNRTKQIFGIVPYDYYFELRGDANYDTGRPISGAPTAVSTERSVMYRGGDATVKITIYREN